MTRVIIDPGHGGSDPGAICGVLKEKTICLAIAKEFNRLCLKAGHEAMLTRTIDDYVSLEFRTTMANVWQADLFVSIHLNADADDDTPGQPIGTGAEVWVYPGSKESRHFAEWVESAVDKFFPGQRFRGIKESKSFYVLRKTTMPSAIVELAFIDDPQSVALNHTATQTKAAEALAWAVNQYDKTRTVRV